jgi:hypothetical protein
MKDLLNFLQNNAGILSVINTVVTLGGILVGIIALVKAKKNEKEIKNFQTNVKVSKGFDNCTNLKDCKAENIGK